MTDLKESRLPLLLVQLTVPAPKEAIDRLSEQLDTMARALGYEVALFPEGMNVSVVHDQQPLITAIEELANTNRALVEALTPDQEDEDDPDAGMNIPAEI